MLGNYSGDRLLFNRLYLKGNNKTVPGNMGEHTLISGEMLCDYDFGDEGICVLGDNSTAILAQPIALAVGNNSQMTIGRVWSTNYFNVALGKNSCVSGDVNICSEANYNGNYTFFTTYDINNFK